MKGPLIVCVMLTTADRQEMTKRAISSWGSQTYQNIELFIYPNWGQEPLCRLMNLANAAALKRHPTAEYIAKWDSDDWSHPRRLEDQLRTIEGQGALVTGYNEMPFVDERPSGLTIAGIPAARDVFTYRNPNPTYALGTSLFMKREAWEQQPFPDMATPANPRGSGSDTQFVHHWASRGRLYGRSALHDGETCEESYMVATVHESNTTCKMKSKSGFLPSNSPLACWSRSVVKRLV